MKGAAAFLPYLAAVFVPALGPARALALGWILEAARPPAAAAAAAERRADWLLFTIGHGCAWGLLHLLRPDAAAWRGLTLLALAASTWPLWRRPARLGATLPLALLAPALLAFLLALGGRDAPVARALDPWRALAPAGAAAARAPLPALPPGAAWSELPLVPPSRLVPHALADSPWRARALTLTGLLFVWRLALALRPRGRRFLLPLGPLLVGAAAWLAAPPAVLELRWASAEPAAGGLLLELHQGDGIWDPLAGPLLPPSSPFGLTLRDDGRFDLETGACWAVVRPAPEAVPAPAAAWLELHPLRAPRSGGLAPAAGALGLLRWWAAADRSGAPARWELGEDGTLARTAR